MLSCGCSSAVLSVWVIGEVSPGEGTLSDVSIRGLLELAGDPSAEPLGSLDVLLGHGKTLSPAI